jgi:hypothetical protein
MKTIVITAIFVFSSTAFADPKCEPKEILGEVQLIPLDGSGKVIGAIPSPDLEAAGIRLNPVRAEQRADGVIELNVYEASIPTKLGQLVGQVGTLQYSYEGDALCYVDFKSSAGTSTYQVRALTAKGALILSDYQDPQAEPALIIQKLRK